MLSPVQVNVVKRLVMCLYGLGLGSTGSNPSGFTIFNDIISNGTFELGLGLGGLIGYTVIPGDPENPKSSICEELPQFPTFHETS